VLLGWRQSTIDIDLKLVPDSGALLRAVPVLKEELEVSVELASPNLFIPVPPGWEDRSPWEATEGMLTVRHFDLTAQAVAKLERGHARDLDDGKASWTDAWSNGKGCWLRRCHRGRAVRSATSSPQWSTPGML